MDAFDFFVQMGLMGQPHILAYLNNLVTKKKIQKNRKKVLYNS